MKSPETARRINEAMNDSNITAKEISDRTGVSQASLSQYINGIHAPGNISAQKIADVLGVNPLWLMGFEIDKNAPLIPPKPQPVKMIPLYSAVSAGFGAVADSNVEKYIIQPSDLPHGEYFGLKVKGDSMEPYIMDGDVVIARQDTTPNDGSIVIAIVNGDEGFCKRLICSDDTVILMSLNSAYPPKVFSREDVERKPVRFVGTVVKLIRDVI